MAKQLNVDLRFSADTTQAKKSIQELSTMLDKIITQPSISTNGFGITAEIERAKVAAAQLQTQLQAALKTDGTLDLGRFNESLIKSGQSLASYESALSALGPTGQQAFAKLALGISQSSVSFRQANGLLTTMWTTLKNVARFQISSSIIHGLVGGIQTAYSYAKNLNESLNNIRIVTGQNTIQMAAFAERANKAARELSSTTLDYTNASLIYYQQGLNDQQVKERTDVTVKLANVSRQSAEEVSNQMTAIWNNFDNGAHSMEYFADVITALGATTASSSEEIATGLQKFAPIAGTIGLSYEKATAALATIVATTRQSAESVGTGLRTIFSRFESLKLGETLEDGVDLTKYTKAMQTIGVNVLDANGKLREMDDILDDVAAHWEQLDDTQRTAFATTVGGVRQYTNLIALFDNWDEMQKNLITASNADGSLQKQADIYASSWEAAQKRVQTAAQAVYKSLIDEDFFIGLDDFITKNLDGISLLIKGLGGLPGVLSLISAAFLNAFGPQVAASIDNIINNIKVASGIGLQEMINIKREANDRLANMSINTSTTSGRYDNMAYQSQASVSDAILNQQLSARVKMSEEEAKIVDKLQQQHAILAENTQEMGQQLQAAEKQFNITSSQLDKQIIAQSKKLDFSNTDWVQEMNNYFKTNAADVTDDAAAIALLKENIEALEASARENGQTLQQFLSAEGYSDGAIKAITDLNTALSNAHPNVEKVRTALLSLGETTQVGSIQSTIDELKELSTVYANLSTAQNSFNSIDIKDQSSIIDANKITQITSVLNNLQQSAISTGKSLEQAFGTNVAAKIKALATALTSANPDEIKTKFLDLKTVINETVDTSVEAMEQKFTQLGPILQQLFPNDWEQKLQQLKDDFYALSDAEENASRGAMNLQASEALIKEYVANVKGEVSTLGQAFTALGSAVMSIASIMNSIKGAINVWKDEDASVIEKITASMTAFGMVAMTSARAVKALNDVNTAHIGITLKNIAVKIIQIAEEKKKAAASAAAVGPTLAEAAAETAEGAAAAGATAPTMGLAAALWSLLAPILPIVVAIGALVAVIGILVSLSQKEAKATEEERQKSIEAAKAKKELADANRELANSFDAALAKYDAAVASGENVIETQKALAEAAREVAAAYGLEAEAALAAMSGDYSHFEQAVNEARSREVDETVAAAERGLEASRGQVLDQARVGTGYAYQSETAQAVGSLDYDLYRAHFGDGFLGGADDRQVANIVRNGNFSTLINSGILGDHSVDIATDYSAESIVQAYDEISQVLVKARETMTDAQIAKSEVLQGMIEWQTKMGDTVAVYKEQEAIIKEYGTEAQALTLGINAKTITDVESYRTQRQKLIDTLEEQYKKQHNITGELDHESEEYQQLVASADAYLESMSSIAKIAQQSKALEAHNKISGGNLEEWVKNYNNTHDKKITLEQALQINPYLNMSTWETQIAQILNRQYEIEIQARIDAAQAGLDLNSNKDTTSQDWANWYASLPDEIKAQIGELTGNTGSPLTGLLVLTQEDREEVLRSVRETEQAAMAAAREEDRALAQETQSKNNWVNNSTAISSRAQNETRLGTWQQELATAQESGDQEAIDRAQYWVDLYSRLIERYDTALAAYEGATQTLEQMDAEDQAQAAIGWLDDFKQKVADMDFDYDEVAQYAKYLREIGTFAEDSYTNMADLERESLEFALAMKALNRGLNSLHSNGAAWIKDLKTMPKDTEEAHKAVNGLSKALEDITGLDASNFDYEWLTNIDNQKLVADVINNVEGALKKLQAKLGSDRLAKLELPVNTTIPQEEFQADLENLNNLYKDFIENEFPDLEVGASIDDTAFYQGLLNMVHAGEMSIDDLNNILAGIGMEVETEEVVLPAGIDATQLQSGQVITIDGQEYTFAGSTSMNENGQVTVTVLKGTKYKGGGGGGGGSGGGGGGGGKQKKKDMPEKDRSSRYHQVTQKQNKNKRRQEAAQDTADRTVGRTRIKQLERQIKLEKESLELSKQKLKEAQKYLEVDKKDLETALKKSGLKMKIEYDADGNITNYEAIMAAIQKKKEELVKQYNAGKISEEKYDEELKELEDLAEAAGNYEETLEAAQEAAEAMVDSINRMLDLQLEKITYDIEFQIELNNQDLAVLEHLFDKIDDDVYSTAASIGILGREMQVLLDNAKKYQQDYANIRDEMYKEADKWRNKAKDDTELQGMLMNYGFYEKAQEELKKEIPNWDKLSVEEQQKKIKDRAYKNWQSLSNEEIINYLNGAGYTEKLEQLQSDLLDLDSQIDDIIDKINQQVINAFNELYDKEQEQIEIFDHYGKVFDNLSTIADLTKGAIGSANAKALQDMLRDRNIVNQGNRLDGSYKLYQQMVAKRKEYEQKMAEATTEEEKKLYEDLAEAAREKERETLEQWQEDLTNVLQSVHDKAEGLMDDVVEEFKKSFINGFGTEDYFNDIYEKAQTNADMFMEDYEKLYRVNELEHQSNKLLEKLDNPKYRKEVLAFQEKLTQYKDKQYKMSQQQVEAEQKWLDLIQARIALEDAQNAKQTVRLQRDNEGNWGYVFTNDADTIADAEAAVEKGIYEYQKALEDGGKSVNDSMRQVSEEYAETMAELQKQLLDGIIDQEEYDKQVERVKELAQTRIDALQKLAHWFWETLEGTSDEMNDIYHTEGQEAPSFGNTVFAQMFGFDSIDEAFNTDGFLDKLDQLKDKTLEIYQNYVGETNTYLDKVDMSVKTLTDDITAWGNAITTASDQNVTAVQQMAEAFDDVMLKSIQAVEQEWDKWLTDLKETQQMLLDLVTSIGDLNREIYYAGDHTDNNPVGIPSQEEIDAGTVEQPSGQPSTEPPSTGVKALNNLPSKTDINNELHTAQEYSDLYNWIQEYNLQEDLINTLLQYLDLQARQASYGFGNIMSGTYTSSTGDTIQQEVHIDANFPSVTNSSEIEEAFENLVNKAAQYANRKRQG